MARMSGLSGSQRRICSRRTPAAMLTTSFPRQRGAHLVGVQHRRQLLRLEGHQHRARLAGDREVVHRGPDAVPLAPAPRPPPAAAWRRPAGRSERARADQPAHDRLAHRSTTQDAQGTVVVQHALGPSTAGHPASARGRAAHRREAGHPGGDPRRAVARPGAAHVPGGGDGPAPPGGPAAPPRLQRGGGPGDEAARAHRAAPLARASGRPAPRWDRGIWSGSTPRPSPSSASPRPRCC